MTELDKLEKYLKEKGIEYSRTDQEGHTIDSPLGSVSIDRHQVTVEKDGVYLWDAICHYGSYGYEQGLLEVMGEALIGHNDVEGWLTAEEVIEKIERMEIWGMQ